jgi:hypothetical protein
MPVMSRPDPMPVEVTVEPELADELLELVEAAELELLVGETVLIMLSAPLVA